MESQHEQQHLRLAFRLIKPVSEPSTAPVPSWLLDGTPGIPRCSDLEKLTLWRSPRVLRM